MSINDNLGLIELIDQNYMTSIANSKECCICLEMCDISRMVKLDCCMHEFCSKCIFSHSRETTRFDLCPLCREEIGTHFYEKWRETMHTIAWFHKPVKQYYDSGDWNDVEITDIKYVEIDKYDDVVGNMWAGKFVQQGEKDEREREEQEFYRGIPKCSCNKIPKSKYVLVINGKLFHVVHKSYGNIGLEYDFFKTGIHEYRLRECDEIKVA